LIVYCKQATGSGLVEVSQINDVEEKSGGGGATGQGDVPKDKKGNSFSSRKKRNAKEEKRKKGSLFDPKQTKGGQNLRVGIGLVISLAVPGVYPFRKKELQEQGKGDYLREKL